MVQLNRNGTGYILNDDEETQIVTFSSRTILMNLIGGTGRKYQTLARWAIENELLIADLITSVREQLNSLEEDNEEWHNALTEAVIALHPIIFIENFNRWYEYDEAGIYKKVTQTTVESYIKEYIDATHGLSITMIGTAYRMLKIAAEKKETDINDYLSLRNCKNGILDLTTMTLQDHSSDYLFTYQYSVDYIEEDLEIPFWERLCTETTTDRALLENWLNCLFLGKRDNEFMLWIVGPTNSGASTFMGLVKKILDPNGVSATPLNTLGASFGLQNIIDSLCNIDADIIEEAFKSHTMSIFKKLIDEDARLDVNIKNAPQTTMSWKGFLLGSSNNLPGFPKGTDFNAIFKRVGFAVFPHTFPNNSDFKDGLHSEASAIFSTLIRREFTPVKQDIEEWIERNREIYQANNDERLTFLSGIISKYNDDSIPTNYVCSRLMQNFMDSNVFNIKQETRGLLMKLGGTQCNENGEEVFRGIGWINNHNGHIRTEEENNDRQ